MGDNKYKNSKKIKSFTELPGYEKYENKRTFERSSERTKNRYVHKQTHTPEKQNQEGNRKDNQGLFERAYSTPDEFREYGGLSPLTKDYIKSVDSNAAEISKINKNLEQKIKSELSGNVFKKGSHLIKSVFSEKYRNTSADELMEDQLQRSASFKDSIKDIYTRINKGLQENVKNIDHLEREYFTLKNKRNEVKERVKKTNQDISVLRNSLNKSENKDKKDEIEMGLNNADRYYRKDVHELDNINNSIFNNIAEREGYYKAELIFEKYEQSFRKIHNTAEGEIRKINTIKNLYLNTMRGGKLVKKLGDSFEETFASLRLMDNVLLKGASNLIAESSPVGSGRIRQLSQEKDENSRRLLNALRNNFVPQGIELDNLIEDYVQGNRKEGDYKSERR